MIEDIRAEALEKARTRIAFLFHDHHSLHNNIPTVRSQLSKYLSRAESQLNMTVQNKLDSLKRAVDLMADSSIKLEVLTLNMKKVDERIAATNSTLSAYRFLKNVDKARDNITKLMKEVEFFAKVPELVEKLSKDLDSDESKLKSIFIESLKLEALRSAIMKEVVLSHSKKTNSTAVNPNDLLQQMVVLEDEGTSTSKLNRNLSGESHQYDPYDRVRLSVKNHLKIVPELSKLIKSRLFGNIERMMDLSAETPENLVATFEVIEMYQEYINRKEAYHRSLPVSNTASAVLVTGIENLSKNIIKEAELKLQERFVEKVEFGFSSFYSEAEEGASSSKQVENALHQKLGSATAVLNTIAMFKFETLPCIPPHYKALERYIAAFDTELLPMIHELTNDVNKLAVGDIFRLLQWFDFYTAAVLSLIDDENHPTIIAFKGISENLLHEYLSRIQTQVMDWFGNIKKQPLGKVLRCTVYLLFPLFLSFRSVLLFLSN